jgi:NosR/NirI family transcriptional regulator, nitrous oxide reductase regulator
MDKRFISVINFFVILAGCFILFFDLPVKAQIQSGKITPEEARLVFPEAKKLLPGKNDKDWVNVYNSTDMHIGSLVKTSPYTDDIKGYKGPVPLLIGIDKEDKIVVVYPLPNLETPRFFNILKNNGFFDNWNGISWKKASTLKVDTVTRATVSSSAVIRTLQRRLSIIRE